MPRLRGPASRTWEAAFGLPLAFVLVLAGQSEPRGLVAQEAGPGTRPTVRVAAPVDGAQARTGDDLRQGARRAVAALNAAGGIAGQPIALETLALACGAKAPTAPSSTAGPAPMLVIVPPCAASAVPASPSVTVLVVSGSIDGIAAAALPAGMPRLPASKPAQGETAARFALARRGSGPFVIVSDGTRYSRVWTAQVRAALRAASTAAPLEFDLAAGAKDYAALGRSLAQAQPAAVFLGTFPAEAAILIGNIEDERIASLLVGMDVLAAETFPRLAGAHAGRIAMPAPLVPKSPANAAPAHPAEDFAYAGVEAWAQAVAADRGKPVSETWRTRVAATVAGAFRFNGDGEPTLPAFVMSRWVDGRLRPVADDGAQR